MRIHYNAPVVLTFALLAVAIQAIDGLIPGLMLNARLFTVPGIMYWSDPFAYVRLVSYVLGHAGYEHLLANLTLLLLLGPMLEEKHGSRMLLAMLLLTALVTAIVNIAFFSTGLTGASGIVFMLITLASVVDLRRGRVPLTFLLVAVIFLGQEVMAAFQPDNISRMAHLVGGVSGAVFGFRYARPRRS